MIKNSGEYKIIIDEDFKKPVLEMLNTVDWRKELDCIAMLRIKQYHIVQLLKSKVENIY